MAWIESHQSLKDHPKTRKLARLLGVSTPTAIGHLHCFWWWSLDYASEGDVTRYDEMDLAIGAEWEGDARAFVDAMVTAGFLDSFEDGDMQIHDWPEYAGKLIERKQANAQRMREARANRVQDTSAPRASHVQRTQRARVELPNQPTIPTKPNQPTDVRFDQFWSAYPSNRNKQAAVKAFGKVDWKTVDFDSVMAALEAHKQSAQWTKDNGQFIPHASTWLNNARWEEDMPVAKASQPASSIAEPKGYSHDPDEAQRQMRRQIEELQRNATSGDGGNVTMLRGRIA